MIVAFDLASRTGYARCREDGSLIDSGVLDLELRDGEHPGSRLVRARAGIGALLNGGATYNHTREDSRMMPCAECRSKQATFLTWERVVSRFRSASLLYVLEAYLVELCYLRGLENRTVNPSTLKKYATGRGRKVPKEEMVAFARARWKIPPERPVGDDEGDALCVLAWTLEARKGEPA